MKIRRGAPRYRRSEEYLNALSHGIGALLAVAGLIVLTHSALLYGDAWHVVSCAIYGVTLVTLYSASTLYHLVPLSRLKVVFQFLDHSAIYLLIAGTYTPFTLVNLRGPWGWSLFGAVWGLALLGIVSRATFIRHRPGIAVVFYVAMGWVAVIAVKPILAAIAPGGLLLIVAGGLTYTAGVVFYAWERLPYNHAVWHVFVLAGSALQFFAVLFYVLPSG